MISQQEYQARRRTLMQQLPAGCTVIIFAANELLRNGDAHFRFRQDSDFYYLTGFNEPDAALVIGVNGESILFNRPKDPLLEQWHGRRLGQDNACQVLGVNAAFALDSLDKRLPDLLAGSEAIAYPIGRSNHWDKYILNAWEKVKGQVRRGVLAPSSFYDLAPIIAEMRLFKSEAEINLMRQAAHISVAAHQRAMQACRNAIYEYELEAELLYEFTRQGCRSVAYDSIVASGENACILHYTENNQPIQSDSLILIDAGGEFQNYAADITRTFPAKGKFSTEQALIYNLVLKAQKAGIACIQPGCMWDDVQRIIVRVLTEGLVELGLLHGDIDALIASAAYSRFYMHNSGHWLGLDVHDCGRYKIDNQWRRLETGMVLTVEPGLYIKAGLEDVDERWWNIGVRIEDDIYVTDEGYENLSANLVVEMDEIEALVRG